MLRLPYQQTNLLAHLSLPASHHSPTHSSKTISLTHLAFTTIRENISKNKAVLMLFWALKLLLSPTAPATAPSQGEYSNMLRGWGRSVCMRGCLRKGWFICDSQSWGDSNLRWHQRHKVFMETPSLTVLNCCTLAGHFEIVPFCFFSNGSECQERKQQKRFQECT